MNQLHAKSRGKLGLETVRLALRRHATRGRPFPPLADAVPIRDPSAFRTWAAVRRAPLAAFRLNRLARADAVSKVIPSFGQEPSLAVGGRAHMAPFKQVNVTPGSGAITGI